MQMHTPSNLSDLVFVGDVHLEDSSAALMMKSDRCAAWGRAKLPVERGFSSSFECCFSTSSSSLAFVLQHNTKHGPTALGPPQSPSAIPNSLSVVVSPDGLSVRSYDSSKSCSVLASAKAEEPFKCGDKIPVSITYELQGDEAPKLFLRAEVGNGLVVEVRVDVHKRITLERGSGRAWVGLAGRQVRVLWWEAQGHGVDDGAFVDAWREMLVVRFDVEWPLHLVLTREQLEAYGMVFQFLLAVKRVGEALKESWQALNGSWLRETREGEVNNGDVMEVLRLRASMAYLINNLQYHLQVDVIDTLQNTLMERIETAANFERVIEAHQDFMNSLITQSFLHNKVIRNSLDTVLRRCLRFCTLVDQLVLGNPPAEGTFQEVAKSFSRDATFLCALLTRMNSNLLLRIDFNGYFTRLSNPNH